MEEYATLQEFFARRLKPELRPIAAKEWVPPLSRHPGLLRRRVRKMVRPG